MDGALEQNSRGVPGAVARPVLVVGGHGATTSRLAGALTAAGHRVRSATAEEAPRLLHEQPFQLVVAVPGGAPPPWLTLLAARLRAPASPSRSAALMVLVPEQVADGERHPGANRVLCESTPLEVVLACALRLLEAQGARNARHEVRLETVVEHGGTRHRATTLNLSASGLLLETSAPLQIGQRFRFHLQLGSRTVSGDAKVMRADAPHAGLGSRFCTFDGDGREQLGRYLDQLRRPAARGTQR